mgnify:CR=1 FL=1
MFKKQEINDHIFPRLKKESYLHRRKLRDYVLRFSENVLPEQKILDFGCGIGVWSQKNLKNEKNFRKSYLFFLKN